MPKVQLEAFDGAEPRTTPTLLADNRAQVASNSKLHSGALAPYLGPTAVPQSIAVGSRTIYKLRRDGDFRWLSWPEFTVVAPGPLPDTAQERIYFAGSSGLRYTDWTLASSGFGPYPTTSLPVAFPAPAAAPTLTEVAGPSLNPETRSYVYTYIRTVGGVVQETAPSPPATISIAANKAVRVAQAGAPPADATGVRIYRARPTTFGTLYAFVQEVAIGVTYDDGLTAGLLGEPLTTQGYASAPANLRWPVNHPSGSLAAFEGNTVWFCEPYKPHAWPPDYAISVPHKIVALGVFGNSIVVLTTKHPYIVSGDLPGEMVVDKLTVSEPCISEASVVSTDAGVMYASPNGLVLIGPSGRGVVTENLFRKDEWDALDPSTIVAEVYNRRYFGATAGHGTIIVDFSDRPALVTLDANMTAVYADETDGRLYYVEDSSARVLELDSDDIRPLPYKWRSKRFDLPQAASWSAFTLDAVYDDNTFADAFNQQRTEWLTSNQTMVAAGIGGGALNSFPLNHQADFGAGVNGVTTNGSGLFDIPELATVKGVRLTIIADDEEIYNEEVDTHTPIRIPAFCCRDVQFELNGTIPVRSLTVATTVEELWQ